jgi:hypothetical protein
LAFILPVLTIFFLGCLDFGRFAHSYIAVVNASRAGAAFGSMNPYPNAPGNPPSPPNATYTQWQRDIRQAVVDEMSQVSGFQSSNRHRDFRGQWAVARQGGRQLPVHHDSQLARHSWYFQFA